MSAQTPPAIGITRTLDDLIVTLTPIPDPVRLLPRGVRRRATTQLTPWLNDNCASTDAARPTRLEAAALTTTGTIRATVSLEPGPAGTGDDSTAHWHLAISITHGGTRRPAPEQEAAAWIGLAWPTLVGAAVDTYLMTSVPSARHAHLPAATVRQLAG